MVWTGQIVPVARGNISLQIANDKTTDLATNINLESNLFQIEYRSINNAPEISNQTFSINEDIIDGTNIGTVVAADIDDDDLTYIIKSGNIDNVFEIDSYSGTLSVINSSLINYNKIPSYSLSVEVEDNNVDSKKAEAIILINIIDVKEIFEANNVFTPKSAKNRLWKIRNYKEFYDFELFIRNNAGLIVYQAKGYENNWDGTYKNNRLPTGTYYYLFSNPNNGRKYSGFINLINE